MPQSILLQALESDRKVLQLQSASFARPVYPTKNFLLNGVRGAVKNVVIEIGMIECCRGTVEEHHRDVIIPSICREQSTVVRMGDSGELRTQIITPVGYKDYGRNNLNAPDSRVRREICSGNL